MRGQVYIPIVNYTLYALCLLVICVFQTSDRLGAAYGARLALLLMYVPYVEGHVFLRYYV